MKLPYFEGKIIRPKSELKTISPAPTYCADSMFIAPF